MPYTYTKYYTFITSHSEFLKGRDTRTHVRAIFFLIIESAENLDFGMQNWQNKPFFMLLVQFGQFLFETFYVLMAISVHDSAQNYIF